MFFPFGNSLQNSQNILFSFSSKWSHLYLSFHDSWNFRVFLIRGAAGIVGVVLLSWSCFPPKKELSELWTCFRLDISTSRILKENIDTINIDTKSRHIESHNAFHFRVEPRLLPSRRTPSIFCSTFLKRLFSGILCLLWDFLACFSTIQK